jgi:AGZA family xanthine/uracil permease-like MFS transporter
MRIKMTGPFRWWHKGDMDGFFGLFVDNLIQLILIVVLCNTVLRMPTEMVFGRILPGAAVSLLIGNIFYAFQARSLAQRTGRCDVTALPYGINTISLFAFILFVMKPVLDQTHDVELAWQVGLAACLGSGLIELCGAFVAGWVSVSRLAPRCWQRWPASRSRSSRWIFAFGYLATPWSASFRWPLF